FWGDGNYNTVFDLQGSGTIYHVSASHRYEQAAGYTIRVRVDRWYGVDAGREGRGFNDAVGDRPVSVTQAVLQETTLRPWESPVGTVTWGREFDNVPVATFLAAEIGDDPPSAFSASIDWGDGTITRGTIDPDCGCGENGFRVLGSRNRPVQPYQNAGQYLV